jgi:hypothetical protein
MKIEKLNEKLTKYEEIQEKISDNNKIEEQLIKANIKLEELERLKTSINSEINRLTYENQNLTEKIGIFIL